MSEPELNEQEIKSKMEFKKILVEFCKDLLLTFHELQEDLHDDLIYVLQNANNDDQSNEALDRVYLHCKSVFPERFFDILYQNQDVFTNQDGVYDFKQFYDVLPADAKIILFPGKSDPSLAKEHTEWIKNHWKI